MHVRDFQRRMSRVHVEPDGHCMRRQAHGHACRHPPQRPGTGVLQVALPIELAIDRCDQPAHALQERIER